MGTLTLSLSLCNACLHTRQHGTDQRAPVLSSRPMELGRSV